MVALVIKPLEFRFGHSRMVFYSLAPMQVKFLRCFPFRGPGCGDLRRGVPPDDRAARRRLAPLHVFPHRDLRRAHQRGVPPDPHPGCARELNGPWGQESEGWDSDVPFPDLLFRVLRSTNTPIFLLARIFHDPRRFSDAMETAAT